MAKKKAPPYPGYVSPAQLLKLAQQAVAAELLPQQQEVQRQRDTSAQRQADQARLIQGLSLAAADILKGAGPQTAEIYQSGARDQAAFGKGFSDGMRMLIGKSADQTNQFLTNVVGAPEGQLVKPNNQADVLYGLGGYIPGSTMEREGAAFGAAASRLPATALGRGQMDIAALSRAAGTQNDAFDQQLRDLEARRPGLVQQALQQLNSQELQKQATAIQGAYLANTQKSTSANISGYYLGADGQLHPTFQREATVASATAKKTAAQTAARTKAVTTRESTFKQARQDMITYARQNFVTPNPDLAAGLVPGHPKFVKKGYQDAYNELWSLFGTDLLRFAGPAGKSALKARINMVIKQVLAGQGIKPKPKPTAKTPPATGGYDRKPRG